MKKFTFLSILIMLLSMTFITIYAQSWIQVSAGGEYSMALRADSTIWSWGFNANGQLGLGDTDTRNSPKQMGAEHDWVFIETGGLHSFAIKENGTLWSWGLNGNGQLGVGCGEGMFTNGTLILPEEARSAHLDIQFDTPQQVGQDSSWWKVAAGFIHTLALKNDSTLWAWGDNTNGLLGDSTTQTSCTPVQIGKDRKWMDIDCGGLHSLALDSEGRIWSWGFNGNGQLGLGTSGTQINFPQLVESLDSVTRIDAGLEFSTALRADGSIWSWGFNGNGQLGLNDKVERHEPTQIGEKNDWADIKTGSVFTFALKENGQLYAWGLNMFGNLGIGTNNDVLAPTPIHYGGSWRDFCPSEGFISNIYIIGFHTLGLSTIEDYICATGLNFTGQLGDFTTVDRNEFTCDIADFASNAQSEAIADKIQLFPNPVINSLHLNSRDQKITSWEVLSISGKVLKKSNAILGLNRHTIECSTLPFGIYLVRVHFADGICTVNKFVKQ